VTQPFTLTVNQPPAITSANNATFQIGTPNSFNVTATGFPVPAIVRGGVALPAGMTYTDNGNGTGTLSGTPAPGTNGTYAITFTASNSAGTTPPQNFTLTVTAPTPIHDIQGSANTSPLVGQTLTTTGIVTALRSNGFFLQTPDANADADPNTSEGIFVFTSSAPPAAAAIGNDVNVSGTVTEFIPVSDPTSPPLTEITSPTVSVNSTGNPLPVAVTITAADTQVNNVNNLERYEGMRIAVGSLTVVEPTGGAISEANATSTSTGAFYGVITGVARPFIEPGIPATSSVPPPNPANVPRFDTNPERLRVDSAAQAGSVALEVTSGAVVSNVTGVLDYTFSTYTILPDTATPPTVTGNIVAAAPLPTPTTTQLTVASLNLQRFFDTADDPTISDPLLTATAFNNRLNKASLAARTIMRAPDVIGVQEVENLTTLQALATKINNDAVAAAQPNPNYTAFLVEGNDVNGVDVGFLVKAARVTVVDVTQFGKTTTYINPDNNQPETLNDRPPLVLRATVPDAANQPFAFTVIVNHLRSLSGIGDPVDGNRVRTKRRAQAEFLANLVQTRQTADSTERILVLGDFNAYQFNDGYVDVMGTIKGTPAPADQVVLPSSDLVNPDLTNLAETISSTERYSYSFGGNAEVLDHTLVTGNLVTRIDQFAYARFDADFPESLRNNANGPERISDHDAPVSYISLAAAAPSPTPTATATATPTATATATATPTATATATATPTATATATPTATATATPTATATASPTATATATPTATATASPTATPTATPTSTPTPTPGGGKAQALNISTRLRVDVGDRVMIGGFIITGNVPKPVVLRGLGPSLVNAGIPAGSVLNDPVLELHGSSGALITMNDNWKESPQRSQIEGTIFQPSDDREAVILATLPPAAYTVILKGAGQTTGIGLVEVYDNNQALDSDLANISTRGFVLTGENVMIGGFTLGGNNNPTRIAVRALGPSLASFGLSNVLADPTLELHNANGTIMVSNDDWQSDPVSAAQLTANGLALSDPRESGIFSSVVPPGQFTAVVAGKNGGIGIALVEIYNLK
jgi:predicted extracellular nuclease